MTKLLKSLIYLCFVSIIYAQCGAIVYSPLSGMLECGGAVRGASNIFSVAGAANTPAISLTGALYTAGDATTAKALFLIEPVGTTSTGWSTAGTGLGINTPAAFTGRSLDIQFDGVSYYRLSKIDFRIGEQFNSLHY